MADWSDYRNEDDEEEQEDGEEPTGLHLSLFTKSKSSSYQQSLICLNYVND